MSQAFLIPVIADLCYLLLAALLPGMAGYILSLALPAAAGILWIYRRGVPGRRLRLRLSPRDTALTVLSLPLLLLVMTGISALTSLVLGRIGFTAPATDLTAPTALLLLRHALLPAVLEEALFRYLPLSAFPRENPKNAVVYSAVFFAVMHLSFYRIPYAFVAGLLFAALDLMTGSILPSLLLHFANNALSVLCMKYSLLAGQEWMLCIGLLLLSLLATGIAAGTGVLRRFCPTPAVRAEKMHFDLYALLLVAVGILLSVIALF